MERTARVLALVGDHCDLDDRLRAVPPAAQVRGLWMNSVGAAVAQLGKAADYEALVGSERFSALRYYPLSEMLVRLAGAGGLVAGPEGVHDGMSEITRRHARAFSESLLGRTLLRLLSPDPIRLLQQGVSARRQGVTYGAWELEVLGPRSARMIQHEEYMWIESAQVGAARGTFDMLRLEVEVDVELRSPYEGVHTLRW